jgi:hypothetical protein
MQVVITHHDAAMTPEFLTCSATPSMSGRERFLKAINCICGIAAVIEPPIVIGSKITQTNTKVSPAREL